METVYDWLRRHGSAGAYRVGTLHRFAQAVRQGEDFRFVLREFLDDVNLVSATRPTDLDAMIAEESAPLNHAGRHAFLGALAEHLAMVYDLQRPRWSVTQAGPFPAGLVVRHRESGLRRRVDQRVPARVPAAGHLPARVDAQTRLMADAGFDRSTIERALSALGRRLDARGLQGDLFVVGGAAMALAYNAERFTRDVDAMSPVPTRCSITRPRSWGNATSRHGVSSSCDRSSRSLSRSRE